MTAVKIDDRLTIASQPRQEALATLAAKGPASPPLSTTDPTVRKLDNPAAPPRRRSSSSRVLFIASFRDGDDDHRSRYPLLPRGSVGGQGARLRPLPQRHAIIDAARAGREKPQGE